MDRGHNQAPPHRSALRWPALEPALLMDGGTRSNAPTVAKEVPWVPKGLPPSWVEVAGVSPPRPQGAETRTCCPPGRGEGREPVGLLRRCRGTEHTAYMERMGATSSREAIRIPISQMQAVSSRAHVGSPLALPWPKTWRGARGAHQGSGVAAPVPHSLGQGSLAQPGVARPSHTSSPVRGPGTGALGPQLGHVPSWGSSPAAGGTGSRCRHSPVSGRSLHPEQHPLPGAAASAESGTPCQVRTRGRRRERPPWLRGHGGAGERAGPGARVRAR